MTTISVAVASILALTTLAWLVRTASRQPICPLCVGVSATWAGLVVARLAGMTVEPTVLALLLGASVLGGAQWVEARLPAGRSPLVWKTLALSTGAFAAHGVVMERWMEAGTAAAALGVLAAVFLRKGAAPGDARVVAELQERMKKCC